MARDTKDSKTVDAFPAKKRGRPATGTAKTAAVRMAEKRERDRAAINRARTPRDYFALPLPALLQALGEAVSEKNPKLARIISEVVVERSKERPAKPGLQPKRL